MAKRVVVLFPVMLLVLIRQFYANLLGIGRDWLTLALVVGLSMVAVWAVHSRFRERRRDLLVVDSFTLVQFFVAAIAIWAYCVGSVIEPSEAVAALYYYCFAPCLIYAGFLICRLQPVTQRAALAAAGCAYLVTVWVAVYESLGIDFRLFEYDRWELQRNFAGFARASGLYGTQIDYGFLSFLAFGVAFYWNPRRRHWFATIVMALSVLGVLLSMSRIWIAADMCVVLVYVLRTGSLKRKLRLAAGLLAILAILYPIANQLGVVGMFLVQDELTHDSNIGRIEYFRNMPQWLLDDYPLVGTGPGTQNGPDVRNRKFVTDFLWLAILIDFGALVGAALVLLRAALLLYLLVRAYKASAGSGLASLTLALSLAFILASLVNSAFVHLVSVSIFYVIAGLFLHHDAAPNLQQA